jgi:hypothetical protein
MQFVDLADSWLEFCSDRLAVYHLSNLLLNINRNIK